MKIHQVLTMVLTIAIFVLLVNQVHIKQVLKPLSLPPKIENITKIEHNILHQNVSIYREYQNTTNVTKTIIKLNTTFNIVGIIRVRVIGGQIIQLPKFYLVTLIILVLVSTTLSVLWIRTRKFQEFERFIKRLKLSIAWYITIISVSTSLIIHELIYIKLTTFEQIILSMVLSILVYSTLRLFKVLKTYLQLRKDLL